MTHHTENTATHTNKMKSFQKKKNLYTNNTVHIIHIILQQDLLIPEYKSRTIQNRSQTKEMVKKKKKSCMLYLHIYSKKNLYISYIISRSKQYAHTYCKIDDFKTAGVVS